MHHLYVTHLILEVHYSRISEQEGHLNSIWKSMEYALGKKLIDHRKCECMHDPPHIHMFRTRIKILRIDHDRPPDFIKPNRTVMPFKDEKFMHGWSDWSVELGSHILLVTPEDVIRKANDTMNREYVVRTNLIKYFMGIPEWCIYDA